MGDNSQVLWVSGVRRERHRMADSPHSVVLSRPVFTLLCCVVLLLPCFVVSSCCHLALLCRLVVALLCCVVMFCCVDVS